MNNQLYTKRSLFWFVFGLSVPLMLGGSVWLFIGCAIVLMFVWECYGFPIIMALVIDTVMVAERTLYNGFGFLLTLLSLCVAGLVYVLRRLLAL